MCTPLASKFGLLVSVLFLSVFTSSAREGAERTIRHRPTSVELAAKHAAGPSVHGASLNPKPPVTQTPRRPQASFLSRSTILAHGGHWTIVPKNAVVHIPGNLQERIVEKPEGTLIPWAEFYRKNRGWLYSQTVRMSDARGDTSLEDSTLEAHRSLGRIVVAVLNGGPISMPARPSTLEGTK